MWYYGSIIKVLKTTCFCIWTSFTELSLGSKFFWADWFVGAKAFNKHCFWSFSKSQKMIVTNCLVFFVNILVIFMVHVHIKIISLVGTDNNIKFSTLSFKKIITKNYVKCLFCGSWLTTWKVKWKEHVLRWVG